jgi:non-lysosomal glucosylceramidase
MKKIPPQVWTRRFDQKLETPGKPYIPLSLGFILKNLAILPRLSHMIKDMTVAGFEPWNMLKSNAVTEVNGVPLGGIGATIGRGWRGDFNRWSIRPGFIHYGNVPADQFSLFVQRGDSPAQTTTLSPVKPTDGSLSAWNWALNPSCATYHALYPRAWTVYENPLPGIRLTYKQVSPFIPHNYKESSYPVAVFEWTVENIAKSDATVGLMFSFQNGWGTENDAAGGHANEVFSLPAEKNKIMGVTLCHQHRQFKTAPMGQKAPQPPQTITDPITFALAVLQSAGVQVSYFSRFITSGDGAHLWQDFSTDGKLDNLENPLPSSSGEIIGAAVAVTIKLKAGASKKLVFSLAWDMPLVHFGMGTPYYRRHTVFYGTKGDAAPRMARDAILNYPSWEKDIIEWQSPILANKKLPEWYKTALFNELYYIPHGGTFWGYPADQKPSVKDMGHFGYLEGHEYRMVNTYDVHYNASIALAMLFPKIELSLQRDFAKTVLMEIPDQRSMVFEKEIAPRKVRGSVPHDLGWPDEDPWVLFNGYNFHDVSKWKDLNPKFVMQIYRDYTLTKDKSFLKETWPAVKAAVEYMFRFDRDGDGLIENDAFPDQTYDTWSVEGPSSYTGSLWLGALSAAVKMALLNADKTIAKKYEQKLKSATAAFEAKLWNGSYFNYDSSHSKHHDSIMADQVSGFWFAAACGLPPIVDPQHIKSALKRIFEVNVMGVENGSIGAMNGMHPDGSIDKTSMQSQEVWVGTTDCLAAAMLQAGLTNEAFKTIRGLYHMTYEKMGYWFTTPEAWYLNGGFRSLTYMRPLAIWAVQHAWEQWNK